MTIKKLINSDNSNIYQNDDSVLFNLASSVGKITTCELPPKIKWFDFCPSIERNITVRK